MSWRKLAIVQLVQKVFKKEDKRGLGQKEEETLIEKEAASVSEDNKQSASGQALLKSEQKKSDKEQENKTETIENISKTKTEKKPKKVKTVQKKESKPKIKTDKKEGSKKPQKENKTPSKKELKLKLYHDDIKKHLGSVDDDFLEIIVKNLGPSIYRKDAESVACGDPKELERVKNNFLVKKLQMPKDDKEALDKAVNEVCEKLKGVRTKYRATFYYMLAKNLKKESMLS